jgi:hypothetical protein
MTTIAQLRAKAQRYRMLALSYDGDTGDALRAAADEVDRQAAALDAYDAAARLIRPQTLSLSA